MPFKPSPFSYAKEDGLQFSLIIPLYNEQDNILPLVEEIEWVMSSFKDKWELILINDGSIDNTQSMIDQLIPSRPFLRSITFKKNSGQTAAFDAGFKAARGLWTITLDGDGQNDPRDIPLLIDKVYSIDGGYDLVAGKRTRRQDSWYKKAISKVANQVRSWILKDNISDTGCSLKLYRTKCLGQIRLYKGMHRFLPALFQLEGFSVSEVPVHHRERRRGKSKYHLFNRGISLFFDTLAIAWMRKRKTQYEIEKELP
jgi:dolichol-phosphate mannosyltransferase